MTQSMQDPDAMRHMLLQVLRQVGEVVASLSDPAYHTRPTEPFEGTIGGHVRHVLDHVRALTDALSGEAVGQGVGQIDYDARLRGTPVESDRQAALLELERQIAAVEQVSATRAPVRVAAITDPTSGQIDVVESTVARELLFVLSHTIHHNAMIGAMVRQSGGKVPAWFGYAPSTQAAMRR